MNSNKNFSVLYSFNVKEGKQSEFINAWTVLTKLIYQFEGSYGSRLHQVDENLFLGYAQWPDKKTWQNSGSHLPEEAIQYKQQMRDTCLEIKTELEMYVIIDLIKENKFKNHE